MVLAPGVVPFGSVSVGVAAAGGDEQGGAVSEDAFLGAAAVVPARRDFDRGLIAAFAGRMVPGGDGGGVGADVAGPALEQPAMLGELWSWRQP